MNNELIAKVIFDNKLATKEQILECWPDASIQKDIGTVLVERGLLPSHTYGQLMAYVQKLEERGPVLSAVPSSPALPAAQPPGHEAKPDRPKAHIHSSQPRPEATQSKAASVAKLPPLQPGMTGYGQLQIKIPEHVDRENSLQEILVFARKCEASDLHISAGNPILIRQFGVLKAVTPEPFPSKHIQSLIKKLFTPAQLAEFEESGDLETIYTIEGAGRFRITLMKHRSGWDLTARIIPMSIRTFEESGLPEACRGLTKWAQGLVLVTGPVGCGKTSTLSTLVEMVNQTRPDHIVTIEDPIEILYAPAKCQVTQREVKMHTLSQENALKGALRQDPDILVVGELRDLASIQMAVSAAETGHLVFGTMNTTNASRTIYRLIDSFPPEEQGVIRNMISESLRGIVSQQLIPLKSGEGMVPAFEVLIINSAVANMIRKDEAHQLGTAMITGKSSGMVLLDDSLRTLMEKGLIVGEEAFSRATSPRDFEKYLGHR